MSQVRSKDKYQASRIEKRERISESTNDNPRPFRDAHIQRWLSNVARYAT
jgi:hypothetical protein